MVRISEVPLFLIVFDLLFQMQEKSRRSISKKVRIALVDLIWGLSEIGRYALFCLSIDEILILTIIIFVQLLGGCSLWIYYPFHSQQLWMIIFQFLFITGKLHRLKLNYAKLQKRVRWTINLTRYKILKDSVKIGS